jgi:predicted lipoprotein with Yx(FWY)xxD motif
MRRTWLLVVAVALALAGCGDEEETAPAQDTAERPARTETQPKPTPGTGIEIGDSEFGRMLFGSNGRAIYIFERDPKGKTVCYGECARAWPPVYTKGEPRAGSGVRRSLLGTVKRRDGRRQVTYAGKPLYFYAHEAPGEVRCHNVNLNGGLWWVVGPDGERRP